MSNLGSSNTPIKGLDFELPAGAQIAEDGGDFVIKDSEGSIILRRDETNGQWNFESTDIANAGDVLAENLAFSGNITDSQSNVVSNLAGDSIEVVDGALTAATQGNLIFTQNDRPDPVNESGLGDLWIPSAYGTDVIKRNYDYSLEGYNQAAIFQSPINSDEYIFLDGSNYISARNKLTGNINWETTLNYSGANIIDDQYLYTGTGYSDIDIEKIDLSDGTTVFDESINTTYDMDLTQFTDVQSEKLIYCGNPYGPADHGHIAIIDASGSSASLIEEIKFGDNYNWSSSPTQPIATMESNFAIFGYNDTDTVYIKYHVEDDNTDYYGTAEHLDIPNSNMTQLTSWGSERDAQKQIPHIVHTGDSVWYTEENRYMYGFDNNQNQIDQFQISNESNYSCLGVIYDSENDAIISGQESEILFSYDISSNTTNWETQHNIRSESELYINDDRLYVFYNSGSGGSAIVVYNKNTGEKIYGPIENDDVEVGISSNGYNLRESFIDDRIYFYNSASSLFIAYDKLPRSAGYINNGTNWVRRV